MKTPFLAPACLAATLFVLPARAADTPADPPRAVPAAPTPASGLSATDAEILKRYDLNHDGKLDDNEVAAAMEQNREAADAGRAKRLEQLEKRRQAWLGEFDRNGDGKLDPAERAAMERTLRVRLERRPRLLKRFDTDGDGKLNDAEWAVAREKLLGPLEKGRAK